MLFYCFPTHQLDSFLFLPTSVETCEGGVFDMNTGRNLNFPNASS